MHSYITFKYYFSLTNSKLFLILSFIVAFAIQPIIAKPNHSFLNNHILSDSIRPVPSINTSSLEVSGPFDASINFSEEVFGLNGDDLMIENGTLVELIGNGSNYSMTILPTTGGMVNIQIPSDIATDEAGNGNIASGVFGVTYMDDDAPSVELIPESEMVDSIFAVQINFSEPIENLDISHFNVSNGAAIQLLGGPQNYTLIVSPGAVGAIAIFLPAGLVGDAEGNLNLISNFVIVNFNPEDIEAPIVTIETDSPEVNGCFQVRLSFTETVNDLFLADLIIENGSVDNLLGDGLSYTLDVCPIEEGDILISLPADAVFDEAGNGNEESTQLSIEYIYVDLELPTAMLSTASNTINGEFLINILFNEEIEGLERSDFEIENGVAGTLSGSGKNYALYVEPLALGSVGIFLPEDQVVDAAGNRNVESNFLVLEYVDDLRPKVELSVTNLNVEEAFEILITFSEEVDELQIGDFFIGNGVALSLTGEGMNYVLLVDPSNRGTVQVALPANQAFDLAGNGNTASTLMDIYYVGDEDELFDLRVMRREYKLAVSWALNTDYKTAEFILERSPDGLEFDALHTQVSETNSTVDVEYNFEDQDPLNGLNYYRIKQIYEDGTFAYSEIESIYFLPIGDDIMVFPSPAQHTIYLNLLAYEGKRCEVILYNSLGQISFHEIIEALPGYPVPLDISEYQEGVYGIQFRIKEVDKFSYKFMIMRNL